MALKPCSSADGLDKGLRGNNLLDDGRCGRSWAGTWVVIKQREHLLLGKYYSGLHHRQQSSVIQSCLTLRSHGLHTPGFPIHHQFPEVTQTHVHWVGDVTQPSYPLSSPSPLASVFPSIMVFSNESVLWIRWPKHWSFSFSITPSNEYLGLISFRMDWFGLLEVQGTLNFSIPQFQSINSMALSLLYAQTHSSLHVYWKNHCFDYTDLCQQSDVSAF